jgi:DNA modification methylase
VSKLVLNGSATCLPFPDNSIHCIVTSPPYNVGVPYDGYNDSVSWPRYIDMMGRAASEMERVLVSGGRCWVNVPPTIPMEEGSDERVSLLDFWMTALGVIGLKYRDTIVWQQDSYDGGTAWGSWQTPSCPNTRGGWESILCFFKDHWKREAPEEHQGWRDRGAGWEDLTRNVWKINPARAKFSPAPFPLELPTRCIRLSTWPGERVLDPFGGGGTTAEAADNLARVGISIDLSWKQTQVTRNRLHDIFS